MPKLALLAVWAVEGGKDGLEKVNADGSKDHGAFQINSFWLQKFSRDFGVKPEAVRDDFCTNVMSAAWVMRYEINRAKGDFWVGIARYHSPSEERGWRYVAKVAKAADLILAREERPGK